MLKNTTFNLPEDLVARAKAYAAAHGTTMTAIVREHLEAVTSDSADRISGDPLLAYSQGRLARNEAIRLLGLRDYAELLVALGDADLPMPLPPSHEIENQAVTFAKLWRQS
jgi:plasmid stability protein